MRLSAATSFQQFERFPLNRYWLEEHFCFWQLGSDACGLIAWGAPNEREARAMTRAFEITLKPPVERHISLVDVRDLTSVDAMGFEIIHGYMAAHREAFAPIVQRQALLYRAGAFGAAIIGMYHLIAPAYPFRAFVEFDQALTFLSPERQEDLQTELEALREQIFGTPAFVLRLRTVFDACRAVPSVAELAHAFGMSQRTFQRRLAEHHTGYHVELQRWRLSRAELLLASSSLSMNEIAQRLDFATASSFVAAFRAARGVTPDAWRQQSRAAGV